MAVISEKMAGKSNNCMFRIATFTMVCLAFLTPILQQSSSSRTQHRVRVRGAVKSLYEKHGVPEMEVTLEGTGGIQTAVTDYFGKFEIEALPGIYRLKFSGEGCNPLHLAAFRLGVAGIVIPEIRIEPCGIVELQGNLYDFTEDTFNTPRPADEPSELLIRYAHRFERKDPEKYRGKFLYRGMLVSYHEQDENSKSWVERDKYLGVMVSYNGLLIYADTVRFNKKTLKLEAEGNITLYKGDQGTRAKRVNVDFSSRKPIETLQIK